MALPKAYHQFHAPTNVDLAFMEFLLMQTIAAVVNYLAYNMSEAGKILEARIRLSWNSIKGEQHMRHQSFRSPGVAGNFIVCTADMLQNIRRRVVYWVCYSSSRGFSDHRNHATILSIDRSDHTVVQHTAGIYFGRLSETRTPSRWRFNLLCKMEDNLMASRCK